MGSKAILNTLSTIYGISLASNGLDSSKHGFVFASIRYGLKASSNMKS